MAFPAWELKSIFWAEFAPNAFFWSLAHSFKEPHLPKMQLIFQVTSKLHFSKSKVTLILHWDKLEWDMSWSHGPLMNCLWPKKSKQHVLRSLQLLQVLQKTHFFEATTSTMEPGVSQYTNTSSWCWLVLRETLAISKRFCGIINPGLDLNVCHESEHAQGLGLEESQM